MEWLQFIVIGWTLTFMIPFVLWNCLLIYCVEDESPGYALISTIVFIILIQICSNFSIPGWISMNTGNFIKWILSYIVIGVIYSVIKYVFYLIDKRRKFDKKFNSFKSNRSISAGVTIDKLPDVHKRSCYDFMRYDQLPDVYTSTKYIVFWMGYWPWSALWTLLNNPLKWLYEEIKIMLSGLFKRLHKSILGSREEAFKDWENTDKYK